MGCKKNLCYVDELSHSIPYLPSRIYLHFVGRGPLPLGDRRVTFDPGMGPSPCSVTNIFAFFIRTYLPSRAAQEAPHL
jgi:hypothetical protein